MAIPMIIDCDPGIDDALTLAMIVASPEVDLLGVTTVAGNCPVQVTTANAVDILAMLGRADVPVAAGAARALVHTYEHGLPLPHGANGVGGATLPTARAVAPSARAVELLRDVLTPAAPRSVVLVATAPLTNVALFVALHPELVDRISSLVVMGGSCDRGNITPTAEFNTWTDPEAAQRVLTEPGLDVCLVGLNVTRRATLTPAHLELIRGSSAAGAMLADMVMGYRDRNDQGWPIHDAVTVAALIDPNILVTRPAYVEVDTGTGVTRGQTIVEFADGHEPRDVGCNRYTRAGDLRVAVDIDVPRFQELLVQRLQQIALSAVGR